LTGSGSGYRLYLNYEGRSLLSAEEIALGKEVYDCMKLYCPRKASIAVLSVSTSFQNFGFHGSTNLYSWDKGEVRNSS